MLSSLKKWVQDVTVDLTPPPQPPQPSTSSPSLSSTVAKLESAPHYPYSIAHPYGQQRFNEHVPANSSIPTAILRPVSMDNVRSSKTISTPLPPPPASPVELDLSHLNREEQEHIANVLRRARAVDEQQSTSASVVVPLIQSPPPSIVSASFSSSTSLSSSSSSSSSPSTATSANSRHTEKPENNEQDDKNNDNEICVDEALTMEPTSMDIYRCQVCNKQLQKNTIICQQCRDNQELPRLTENTVISLIPTRKSSSPIMVEFNHHHHHDDDKIYDNVTKTDQELIKQNPANHEHTYYVSHPNMVTIHDHQYEEKEDNKDKQLYESSIVESKQPLISVTTAHSVKARATSLTEIDESDFFYQEPSPYTTTIDNNLISDKIDEPIIPSYKIDECVEEDDNDERDHVKELEETIANLSRHFPITPQQISNIEQNQIVPTNHQTSTLSADNIDIDSILEMEIESPSTEERSIQSSSTAQLTTTTTSPSQNSVHVPIAVPILINNNHRGSLSRSSGIRENLTDLLSTSKPVESYPAEKRPLQRAASTHSKRMMPIHRQKRNLPSVPEMPDYLQLRRTNSESRFCLPAVSVPVLLPNSNIDDESDLLEIDLNDPMGSVNKTVRSKTESELATNMDTTYNYQSFNTTNQSPSIDVLTYAKMNNKQLRDQTTNTPPISTYNSIPKTKKKLKKKGSSSPNNTNNYHVNSTYANEQMVPIGVSPTQPTPPLPLSQILQPPLSPPPPPPSTSRPKLQKSTSTEISYPFPVLKLILSRTSLNISHRDGADLGLCITGGHSIPHCMDVTACIERIDQRHKNYNILKNAVQEGDEVLEVGGVPLRGKSALFVQNLMNSIQDEFEIVVRSQHVIPEVSPSIEIRKPEKVNVDSQVKSSTTKHDTLLLDDSNMQRRHSVDTSQHSPAQLTISTVVKSQSTIMPLKVNDSHSPSDQLLAPTISRKKSVSSKERLFSVESLHHSPSTRSIEHLMKVATESSTDPKANTHETYYSPQKERTPIIKHEEPKPTSQPKTTIEHQSSNEESTSHSQTIQQRRTHEGRKSLQPNDPGLTVVGSNLSIDRRNSNESDESDNLSQYFNTSQNPKKNVPSTNDHHTNKEVSHCLKTFITDSDEQQQQQQQQEDEHRPRNSTGGHSDDLNRRDEKKLSPLGSFKFLKKKTKSVDFSNPPPEIREHDYVGDIELQIGHNSEREQLVIRIVQARNLLAKDTNGYSDPFVKVYLLPGRDQENKRRTRHISKTLNPRWDHTVIYGNVHREELQNKMLEFTLWDYDRFKANDFLGQVTIDLKESRVIDDKPHWYRLQALRSREEVTNRSSSPRLYKMTSIDSSVSSSSTFNKTTTNVPSSVNQRK